MPQKLDKLNRQFFCLLRPRGVLNRRSLFPSLDDAMEPSPKRIPKRLLQHHDSEPEPKKIMVSTHNDLIRVGRMPVWAKPFRNQNWWDPPCDAVARALSRDQSRRHGWDGIPRPPPCHPPYHLYGWYPKTNWDVIKWRDL